MPTTITVEDVERSRARDPRAQGLVRERQVIRAVGGGQIVYIVASERVILRQVPGGYVADHECPECAIERPCFRALAAVDAEGTERWIQRCEAVYHAAKVEAAR